MIDEVYHPPDFSNMEFLSAVFQQMELLSLNISSYVSQEDYQMFLLQKLINILI